MTIKYVLRDMESGEYVSSYWDAYQSEEGDSSELVVYATEDIQQAKWYYTYSEAYYHQHLLFTGGKHKAEIVRIGE